MSKPTVIVPNIYFESYRGGLRLTKRFFDLNKSDLFTDKNKEYLVNINSDMKKHINSLNIGSGFFNTLNIKGDICVNCSNVEHFMFRTAQDKDAKYSEYEGRDNYHCENLTVKNPGKALTFSLNDSYFEPSSPNIKTMNLIANNVILDIVKCHKLEQISVQATDKSTNATNRVVLRELPKLKVLDLSKVNSLKTSAFRFEKVNPDCIIKFNPEMIVNSSFTSAYWNDDIKSMFEDFDNEEGTDYSFKIKEIFPNYNNENPIQVSLKDFHKLIWNYCNDKIRNDFEANVTKENKIFESYDKKQQKSKERIR